MGTFHRVARGDDGVFSDEFPRGEESDEGEDHGEQPPRRRHGHRGVAIVAVAETSEAETPSRRVVHVQALVIGHVSVHQAAAADQQAICRIVIEHQRSVSVGPEAISSLQSNLIASELNARNTDLSGNQIHSSKTL